jgi:hypothetical protein
MGSEAVIDHRDLTHYAESFYSPGTRSQVPHQKASLWNGDQFILKIPSACFDVGQSMHLPVVIRKSSAGNKQKFAFSSPDPGGRGEQTWFRARRPARFSSMIDAGLMRKDWRRLFPDRELFVK